MIRDHVYSHDSLAPIVERRTIQGKRAVHTIEIHREVMTREIYNAIMTTGPKIKTWMPENGHAHWHGFKTLGQSTAWLTKFLKKDGWPVATKWQIWQIDDGAYFVSLEEEAR